MCGLLGVCGADESNAGRVAELLSQMAHRGPDDSGTWSDVGVVLGHCRLEIQDLTEKSHQPGLCEDGRRILLYNGEVYNHAKLTREPLPSDTLALCAEPPLNPAALRGMFALAIWEGSQRRLELTRDRFGIKPLYYAADEEQIAFASYARSAADLVGSTEVDPAAVASYLRFGSVQGPKSVFSGVSEVPPGSTLTWRAGCPLGVQSFAESPVRPRRRSRRQVENALRESIRVHTLSDVPVAVFLSAGVDSTLIATLAADAKLDVTAITLGLPGHGLDEAAQAAQTARRLGIPHQVVNITDEDIDFDAFFASMDQPSIDGLNTYLVAQAAKRVGFRVALSGLGADELFAGYSLFRRLPAMALVARVVPERAYLQLLRRLGHGEKAQETVSAGADVARLHEVLRSLWSAEDVLTLTGQRLPHGDGLGSSSWSMNNLTELELTSYTVNTLMRDADVFGMAHSVEIRTPFLDHEVLDVALGYSSWAKAIPTKRLLRGMLKDRGLEHVLTRKKTGFVLPYNEWLAGPLSMRVAQLANGPLPDLLNGPGSRGLLADPSILSTMKLWSLVVLDAWLRRQVESVHPAAVDG